MAEARGNTAKKELVPELTIMAGSKRPASQSITTVAARQHFADLINRVARRKDRVVLTRRRKPLAAVVPIEDMALLEEIEDREDLRAARAALREAKREGMVPLDQVLKEFKFKR
jgi:prevent-host-death family protein